MGALGCNQFILSLLVLPLWTYFSLLWCYHMYLSQMISRLLLHNWNRKESVACSDNNRGIALISILGEVLDLIIRRRYCHAVKEWFAFVIQRKHSTIMCNAAIKEDVLIIYKTKVMDTPACWMQQRLLIKWGLLSCLSYFSKVIFQQSNLGPFWSNTE